MSDNPYKILGLNKTASDAEIKATYRKLAKKHHPDLNPDDAKADARFKAIASAYELLKDKEKRAAFDRGEIDAQGQPTWAGGANSGAGGERQYYRDFAHGSGGERYQSAGYNINPEDLEGIFESMFRQQQNADIRYNFDIDFIDAALGAEKHVTMPDGKSLKITIPEGIKDGQTLRLKGKGHSLSNGQQGDAYIELHIKPHKLFTRKGNDIYTHVPIAINEAILGATIEVETIHGSVKVKIPKATDSGKSFRLKGKGIKSGHHYVEVNIVMPETIDEDLEKTMKDWSEKHSYNPRKKMAGV